MPNVILICRHCGHAPRFPYPPVCPRCASSTWQMMAGPDGKLQAAFDVLATVRKALGR